mmetsp:Transcript_162078/g.519703  ORF Transcript_162078/g.519703 Transcript_162078/m.519703 type:complete len:273 (+) Transcript_162078:359-1177(+)
MTTALGNDVLEALPDFCSAKSIQVPLAREARESASSTQGPLASTVTLHTCRPNVAKYNANVALALPWAPCADASAVEMWSRTPATSQKWPESMAGRGTGPGPGNDGPKENFSEQDLDAENQASSATPGGAIVATTPFPPPAMATVPAADLPPLCCSVMERHLCRRVERVVKSRTGPRRGVLSEIALPAVTVFRQVIRNLSSGCGPSPSGVAGSMRSATCEHQSVSHLAIDWASKTRRGSCGVPLSASTRTATRACTASLTASAPTCPETSCA